MKGTAVCVLIMISATVIPLITADEAVTLSHVAFMSVFSVISVTGAAIDMHYYILPDTGAAALAVTGLLFSYTKGHDFIGSLTGSLLIMAVGYLLRYISRNGFGMGDIKWLGALSLWMQPVQVMSMFYLAFWSGSFYLLGAGRLRKDSRIPFGPFICFAAWISLHYIQYVEAIYWSAEHYIIGLLKALF